MKKLFLLCIVLIISSFGTIQAEGFKTLKFNTANGENIGVGTSGLEIYFRDGNILFSNSSQVIPLTSVLSMEFADYIEDAGVASIKLDENSPVEVFSLEGYKNGDFNSLCEALENLPEGIYVIKDERGNSLKIKVGK